jgi:hypothetical protein
MKPGVQELQEEKTSLFVDEFLAGGIGAALIL